jgi:hypothetical protein
VRVCVSVRWVCVSLAHSHSLSLSVRRSICVYAFVQTVGLSLSLSLYLSVCLGLVHVCMRVCVSCVCVSLSDPPPTPPPPPLLLSFPALSSFLTRVRRGHAPSSDGRICLAVHMTSRLGIMTQHASASPASACLRACLHSHLPSH